MCIWEINGKINAFASYKYLIKRHLKTFSHQTRHVSRVFVLDEQNFIQKRISGSRFLISYD